MKKLFVSFVLALACLVSVSNETQARCRKTQSSNTQPASRKVAPRPACNTSVTRVVTSCSSCLAAPVQAVATTVKNVVSSCSNGVCR